jgi:hypothetical protein
VIRTQISLTEQQAEALRRLSALRSKSQAALLRDALDVLTAQEARAVRVERARQVVGAFASGHTETSTAHDAALDEAYSA